MVRADFPTKSSWVTNAQGKDLQVERAGSARPSGDGGTGRWVRQRKGLTVGLGERCDEIVRLIDETLAAFAPDTPGPSIASPPVVKGSTRPPVAPDPELAAAGL
jgi:hypothetical protein